MAKRNELFSNIRIPASPPAAAAQAPALARRRSSLPRQKMRTRRTAVAEKSSYALPLVMTDQREAATASVRKPLGARPTPRSRRTRKVTTSLAYPTSWNGRRNAGSVGPPHHRPAAASALVKRNSSGRWPVVSSR